ncbi:hypothetical protein ACOSQ4_008549 [Xanthoceras sorbifolium]
MERRVSILLLVLAVSVFRDGADGKAEARVTLSEIDRKLKLLNKPAVKTIKSEDGDIIDCVDIYKQPAFDHPVLWNHKIQARPSFDLPIGKLDTRNESSQTMILQTWQKSGSCPEGTVPIRRIRRQDLLRADSLEEFGRKPPVTPHASNKADGKSSLFAPFNSSKLQAKPAVNRVTAVVSTVNNYTGGQADINLWNPKVDLPDDYTTAQMWLKSSPGDDFEIIESGWMVNPSLYGDIFTRLFVHWTKDSYKTTGCFDLTCSGFVQTGSQVALGASLEPYSDVLGTQIHVTFSTFQDYSGHWWLKIGDNVVGYWPVTLFDRLNQSALLVEWGGEVYSKNVKKTPHTNTEMGSGSFAQTRYGSACFINNLRIQDASLQLKFPESLQPLADQNNCYNTFYDDKGPSGEPIFYFGGPGENPRCR